MKRQEGYEMTEEDKRGLSDNVAMEVMTELMKLQKPIKDLSIKEQQELEHNITLIVYEQLNDYLEK